jgi:hypothetical protein
MATQDTVRAEEANLEKKVREKLGESEMPEADGALRSLRKRLKRMQRKRRHHMAKQRHAMGKKAGEAKASASPAP